MKHKPRIFLVSGPACGGQMMHLLPALPPLLPLSHSLPVHGLWRKENSPFGLTKAEMTVPFHAKKPQHMQLMETCSSPMCLHPARKHVLADRTVQRHHPPLFTDAWKCGLCCFMFCYYIVTPKISNFIFKRICVFPASLPKQTRTAAIEKGEPAAGQTCDDHPTCM